MVQHNVPRCRVILDPLCILHLRQTPGIFSSLRSIRIRLIRSAHLIGGQSTTLLPSLLFPPTTSGNSRDWMGLQTLSGVKLLCIMEQHYHQFVLTAFSSPAALAKEIVLAVRYLRLPSLRGMSGTQTGDWCDEGSSYVLTSLLRSSQYANWSGHFNHFRFPLTTRVVWYRRQ